MRKGIWSALLALLMLAPVVGAEGPTQVVSVTLVKNYDVTTTNTYVIFGDNNAAVAPVTLDGTSGWFGPGTAVSKPIVSSGASTTWTSLNSKASFTSLAVGDLILVNRTDVGTVTPGTKVEDERTIETFTSANSIVVSGSAVDIGSTGIPFRYKRRLTGTAATDAWFNVQGFDSFNIQFDVNTFNATNLTTTLECKVSKFARTNVIDSYVFTAVGAHSFSTNVKYEVCRVAAIITGDAGAQSLDVTFIGAK